MADWKKQLLFDDVQIGDNLPALRLPLTAQRLVMEAGVNRDFEPIHHEIAAAKQAGAPTIFANYVYISALTERFLREWIGLNGQLLKIGPFRMTRFACAGTVTECGGKVVSKREEGGKHLVDLEIWQDDGKGHTMEGKAVVALPTKK